MAKRFTQREDIAAKEIGGFHLEGFIVVDTYDIHGVRLTQGGKLVSFEKVPDYYGPVRFYVVVGDTIRKIEVGPDTQVSLFFNG